VPPPYSLRLVDGLLDDLLPQVPAVLLVGPRGSGKTTTAMRHAGSVVRLDREAEAVAHRADPDAALRGLAEPILLDEWQRVPAVLAAVKRAIDVDPRPGRFLITGSVRADLEADTWPGTGRLLRVPLFGMTVGELRPSAHSGRGTFLDRLAEGGELAGAPDSPDLRGYLELCLRGGFPVPALNLAEAVRGRWYEGYLEQVVTRDAQLADGGRDPARLQRYVEVLALNSAGVVEHKTLYDAAGINRRTALAYDQLLKNLYLLDEVPAWTTNRLKRLTLGPKRYMVDTGLVAGALRVNGGAIMVDGDLLGRLLDTFVCAQLRGQLATAKVRPRLFHLRKQDRRREIDLVVEFGGGAIAALEVKADAAPGPDSARHMAWLRDELGPRFLAGVVLHTGPHAYSLGERLCASPMSALWA
jgi:uncharacterized protein